MSEPQATEIYRQHRPKLWKHVVGQEDAVRVLEAFLKNDKVPHAILFSGPSGCGKTTCARILRSKLKCGDADFEEINCASLRGIDTIREIQQRMNFAPRAGECRVFLLDESHRLSHDAASATLKMLEDTPAHVYFMLCTTDPQKMLKAIITRCTEVRMKQIDREQMLGLVADSAKKMKKDIPISVQRQIVDVADGSARQALVLLHQVLEIEGEENQLAVLLNQDVKRQAFDIVKALLWEKTTWAEVAKLLKTVDTSDPERLRHYILACANTELLKGGKNSARAYLVAIAFSEAWYSCPEVGLARSCYEVLGN